MLLVLVMMGFAPVFDVVRHVELSSNSVCGYCNLIKVQIIWADALFPWLSSTIGGIGMGSFVYFDLMLWIGIAGVLKDLPEDVCVLGASLLLENHGAHSDVQPVYADSFLGCQCAAAKVGAGFYDPDVGFLFVSFSEG
ncbi:hypothetical protein Nepgr_008103 [Nepenthes gracilis]|uniref:Uncharacterized protein n=1 Tax=Nepenthes gracilis TaxID=150966 RepID=A0AAD3S871_NEPGR|nr:hypothetical protein Nepgr_008103 [Nepenthes gracilis]